MDIPAFFANIAAFAGASGILAILTALILHWTISSSPAGARLANWALKRWLQGVDANWRHISKDATAQLPEWVRQRSVYHFLAILSPLDPYSLLTLTPAQLCGQISEALRSDSVNSELLRVLSPRTGRREEALRGLDSLQARLTFRRTQDSYLLALLISLVLTFLLSPPLSLGSVDPDATVATGRAIAVNVALAVTSTLLVPVVNAIAARFAAPDM